jgi:hypothetical protein
MRNNRGEVKKSRHRYVGAILDDNWDIEGDVEAGKARVSVLLRRAVHARLEQRKRRSR